MSDSGLPVPVHPDARVEVVEDAIAFSLTGFPSEPHEREGLRKTALAVLAALDELRASPEVHAARVEAARDVLGGFGLIQLADVRAALAAADAAERGEPT